MEELIASYRRKDFRVDTFRCGGPGGQHTNKTDSGVRITHIETGITSECREHKSQSQNKKEAFRKVAEQIKEMHVQQNKIIRDRPVNVVRSYHHVENRVKDHDTGATTTYTEAEKDLTTLITERGQWFHEENTH
jgi:peptide chain release factor 1